MARNARGTESMYLEAIGAGGGNADYRYMTMLNRCKSL